MEEDVFIRVYRAIISKIINTITQNHTSVTIKEPNWQQKVHEHYEIFRSAIREQMYFDYGKPDPKIDRHKIGAALLKSILFVRPLRVKASETASSPLARMANENLALRTAIAVMQSMGASEAARNGDSELAAIYRQTFQYPPAEDGSYTEHTLKVLYSLSIKRTANQSLDPFLLSNLLFTLEQFHLFFYRHPA